LTYFLFIFFYPQKSWLSFAKKEKCRDREEYFREGAAGCRKGAAYNFMITLINVI